MATYRQREALARSERKDEQHSEELTALTERVQALTDRVASLESDVANLMLAAGFITQVRPVMPLYTPTWSKVPEPPTRIQRDSGDIDSTSVPIGGDNGEV